MNQRRRNFLVALGAGSVVTLAGCIGGGEGPGGGNSSGNTNGGNGSGSTSGGNDGGADTDPPTEQVTKLAADDGDSNDQFGSSVAVSSDGTTAIIGAFGDEDPNGADPNTTDAAGSAYVFDRAGGSWSQQAKLASDDGSGRDEFGNAVAISDDGTTAIVGAWKEAPNGTESQRRSGAGSAYVFDSDGGSWSQQAKLAADDGDSNDQFGRAVALSSDGTTALVGASGDEDPNEGKGGNRAYGAGSAYVFDGAGGSWSQQAKLAGDGGGGRAVFGSSVTISDDGSTALVGAFGDSNANGDRGGAVYVFDSAGGSWSRQAKLVADNPTRLGRFGGSMAMSSDGTTALITATNAAYVFDSDGGSWSQQTKITVDGFGEDTPDAFGVSAALSGDGTVAFVSANEYVDVRDGKTTGSVYAFTGSGSSWSRQAKLTASDGDTNDYFGSRMSISSDSTTAIIAAGGDEDPNGELAGSAYVFE